MEQLLDRFETPRLNVRRTTHDEAAAILRGEQPPGVRFGAGYPSEQAREVADLLAGPRSAGAPGFTSWFMTFRETAEVIGEIGFTAADDGRSATAGYDVSPPFEGRGYTTEALVGLVRHLFAHTAIERVLADTQVTHAASRRVMEKAGMRFVKEFEGAVDGRIETLVLYECVKDWWSSEAAP